MSIPSNKKLPVKIPFYIQQFKFLIVVLAVIIILPGYLFLLRPEMSGYNRDKAVIAGKRSGLEQSVHQLLNYKEVSADYDRISPAEADKVNEILPVGVDKPSLYVNIESIVSDAGLTLENVNITESKSPVQLKAKTKAKDLPDKSTPDQIKGELKIATINFSASGVNYSRLKNLLAIIEKNLRLLDVQSLDYNPADGVVTMSLASYYLE